MPSALLSFSKHKSLPLYLFHWLSVALLVAAMAGSASAALLAALEWATARRESHFYLLALLPFAGFAIGWLYLKYGTAVERGNKLLIEEIHDPKNVLPFRMAPLVFLGTVVSHLFGASVGREGTALQMGGSLADQLSRPLRLGPEDRRTLIQCGISAGFGSIFGVPLAGAVFGLEVPARGRPRYHDIFPCIVASLAADRMTRAWGIHHSLFPIGMVPGLGLPGIGKALLAGAAFGIVGMLFVGLTEALGSLFKKRIHYEPLRPFLGGLLVLAAAGALATTAYLGLGVPTIVRSFTGAVSPWDWAGKFLFTTLSLGSGFKGGEVTPLFYIGATLGNALAPLLALPAALLAGMGFVAVFAGAAKTPLASTVMAFELFGPHAAVFAGLACLASFLCSGRTGIYTHRKPGHKKSGAGEPAP